MAIGLDCSFVPIILATECVKVIVSNNNDNSYFLYSSFRL